ncbi:unnamed protein product [Ostreobium quekettii]|uniref:Helicase ATP-binding domain-containing protein n=1 Tax=Ostreobium quekettii TaxID=121088 RepID=A0A8S1IMR7_9CHLO|nr:unnamed protein product [Ostreobium quekettii]
MKVTVKTLSGEKICLQMGGEQLVGDVVAAVLRQQSSLQSCTLFLRGTSLCSDQRLGTLPLQPTDFLCAVGTRKGKRKQKPMVATNRHIPEANLAHAQPIPDALLEPHRCCTPEPPACSLSMPTGYEGNCQVPGRGAFGSNEAPDGEHRSESRLLNENLGQGPNECTRKRCQVDLWEELNVELSECQIAKTPVATEKQISELECVSGTKSGCPDNKVSDTSYPAGLSEQQFVPKLKKQRIGKELESNAAGGSSSQDGTVYPASLPLPPSLKRLESIFGVLNGLSGFLLRTHIQPTWLNVRAALRDVCQDQSISDGDILAMAELCSTIISVRWGGSAKALRPKDPWDTATTTELSPGSRLPRVPGADVRLEDLRSWFADIRDGYGTVLEGDIRTLIVELNTPMRSSGHTKQNQKGAQELLGNFLCTPGESAPHRSYGSNVRRRTFHQRLVQVVGQIHEDFLRGSDVLLRSTAIREAAPHSGTSGATGDERSHFDPVEEGRWHPQFCLEAVTVRAAVQAAKKLEKLGKAKTDGNGPKRPPSLLKRHIPCTDSRPLDACAFLEHIMQLTWYSDQIVHTESMPARSAVFAKTRTRLSDHVLQALEAQGVRRLFSHQSQAIDAATTGDHVVVSTSTASGKSLCYNIPILQALVDDPAACALYMYPTKALAQDQLRALRQLCMKAAGLHTIQAEIYDGDTPFESRAGICANANLLITNPDMLHLSILPVHTQFARLLSRLRFVVIDEGHAYKGAFGCHTAMVLRRLRRVCERVHGNTPTFIMTSATVPNAKEHMERLAGVQGVVEVSHDGSPSGPKHVSLWNPSLVDSKGKPSKQKDAKLEWERMSKQQQRKILQAQIREANQERSRGSQFVAARGMSEADWLAAVAIGKKRAQQSSSGVKTGVTVSASGTSGKKLPRSQLAGISSGPSGANSCDTSSVCQRDNQRAGQDDVTELHSDCAEPGGPSYECDRRGKDLSTGGKEAPARDSNCDAEALAARVVGGNLASSSAAPDPTETSADRRLLSVEGSTCLENVVCTSAPHPRRQMMWKGTRWLRHTVPL